MNGILEEKTPKGYILKIKPNDTFLVFNRRGATVYADTNGLNSVHRTPVVLFLGTAFIFKPRLFGSYNLMKVARNHILLPYYIAGRKDLHYHLIETEESIDLIPVRVFSLRTIMDFFSFIEEGNKPDMVLVDASIDEDEFPLIEKRYGGGKIIRIDTDNLALVSRENGTLNKDEDGRVSLNLYSSNPVYVAMVNLREFQLTKVKQILLDTDITADDADYIRMYIEAMLKNGGFPNPEKNRSRLDDLKRDFLLYSALMRNKRSDVEAVIGGISALADWSSAMTLLAKAKSMTDDKNLQVEYTDYENLLYEKKETISS